MAKATTTIRQQLHSAHGKWLHANQALFNCVTAFYFDVIQAHVGILDLSNKQALSELEKLTHTTRDNPHPIMPLSAIQADIPAMFRRAGINAALGSARSFFSHLARWQKQKAKAEAKGREFKPRPPVPPRTWNMSVTLYAGMWKEQTGSSMLIKVWSGMRENADRNASIMIGHRLFARFGIFFQEKPPTPRTVEREEQSSGVAALQEPNAQVVGQLSLWARHESGNGHGTAQNSHSGMAEPVRAFTDPLRYSPSRIYDPIAQSSAYVGESEAAGL